MSMAVDLEHVKGLRKTVETVGYLQPIVVEKGTNRCLVGRHRQLADPNWPKLEVEVKDDLHRELIILFGNKQRVVSDEEFSFRVLRIAQILEGRGVDRKRVCAEVSRLLDGVYSQRRIEQVLPKEYKMDTVPQVRSRSVSSSGNGLKSKVEKISELAKSEEAEEYPFVDCKCRECPHKNKCYL